MLPLLFRPQGRGFVFGKFRNIIQLSKFFIEFSSLFKKSLFICSYSLHDTIHQNLTTTHRRIYGEVGKSPTQSRKIVVENRRTCLNGLHLHIENTIIKQSLQREACEKNTIQ